MTLLMRLIPVIVGAVGAAMVLVAVYDVDTTLGNAATGLALILGAVVLGGGD